MNEKNFFDRFLKCHFEYRVEISYAIFFLALLTFIYEDKMTYEFVADCCQIEREKSMAILFLIISVINFILWLLRSWAGACIGSRTLMSKSVETSRIITDGPYAYVRNPVYLVDILSMTAVGFAGPPSAILVLFLGKFLTSYLFVLWEEKMLLEKHGEIYLEYMRRVPRFIPRFFPVYKPVLLKDGTASRLFSGNIYTPDWKDGLLHNFYPLGLAIAFAAGGILRSYLWMAVTGAIAPAIWFFLYQYKKREIQKFRIDCD